MLALHSVCIECIKLVDDDWRCRQPLIFSFNSAFLHTSDRVLPPAEEETFGVQKEKALVFRNSQTSLLLAA